MDTELDSQQRSWALAAERSGRALLSIVNNVLDNAKIEAGAVELESIAFDLFTVVDDALLALRQVAQDKGVALVVAPARDVQRYRTGDPTRLGQVITNLAANAVRFTEQGTVTVGIGGDALRVDLSVTDTGIGMTPEQREHVFTPFTPAESSTARRFGGTGLGLSIVRGLVEQMDGHIDVASAPGAGSSFRVTLPLSALDAAPPALIGPSETDAAAPGSRDLRLLIAEDNEVNELVARATLQRHGMHVDLVCNGADAVATVTRSGYDAVFMDCQMPGMDGLEATRRIRRTSWRRARAACRSSP